MVPPSEQGRSRSERKEALEGKPFVMIAGLPDGKMARLMAEAVQNSNDFALFPIALSSENHQGRMISFGDNKLLLLLPRALWLAESLKDNKIPVVDFTTPSSVNSNAEAYVRAGLHFVMGTTGGDRKKLAETVKNSEVSAVIAPNMAKKIVAFMGDMDEFSRENQGLLSGAKVILLESHQQGKKDTSGTMLAMVEKDKEPNGCFNLLGIPCTKDQIIMIRNPEEQLKLGVPESALDGHGWHFYAVQSNVPNGGINVFYERLFHLIARNNAFSNCLFSAKGKDGLTANKELIEDKVGQPGLLSSPRLLELHATDLVENVGFSLYCEPGKLIALAHNVNGRQVYIEGTMDALRFLNKKLKEAARDPKAKEGLKGRVFSMVDVLNAQRGKNNGKRI